MPPEHAPHIVGLRKPPARPESVGVGGAGRQMLEEGGAECMGSSGDLFRDLSVPTFDIVEVCFRGADWDATVYMYVMLIRGGHDSRVRI